MKNIHQIWQQWQNAEEDSYADIFSGTFTVSNAQGILYEKCQGYRNRAEELPNNIDTAFAIASGTKLFTALAICKLIEAGKLSLQDKLWDVLPHDLGTIDKDVTIFHLLTHSSGVGDYLDDEDDDVIEKSLENYAKYPVHLWTNLEYYLQLFTHLPPKYKPGERYGYSNTGYCLLGLVVEAVSKRNFQDYVTEEIIVPLGLVHTGFYKMNQLPANTAIGYTHEETGIVRSNIYEVPIIGGADGGLFSCAKDWDVLWRALVSNKILSPDMTKAILSKQITRDDEDSARHYGFGLYYYHDAEDDEDNQEFYYALGCDAGVNFMSVYFPEFDVTATALCNFENAEVIPLLYELASLIYQ